ncbi:helix-turn-helix transcriptional regulator [Gordonia aquimaris]|uniref:Helix-turn-helix transcriptional regulator n=1 Tax=Gordonia aquimaris TaxID=2984863 RepID=A0A9X3I330_9ACTN|nr:helix-turn-helix transcriptional regulator [Gordonia aquimaris]MCX2963148.1 helix-turn-helix transcriptional regulator [Gordonia aquimaris]
MVSHTRADDRLVEQVAGICARTDEPLRLLEHVARAVRRHVPYAVAGWLLVDPDTLLITGVYEQDVPREAHLALIELELTVDDVNKFVDLARGSQSASSLSAATDGHLDRSARWAQVYRPRGYGDELRAVFRAGQITWGHVCMTRLADDPWFTGREVDIVARLSPHVAHGLRAGLLLHHSEFSADQELAMVVLDDAGRVMTATDRAQRWLGSIGCTRLDASVVVHEVAAQARALADGERAGPPAFARTQGASGEWLLVRGMRLDATSTAVVLEPARRADIAPLLLHLHELTAREQEVTQLLLTGMDTADVAQELWITPETLRGHIKSIFTKLGVRSRPELLARLQHQPRVHVAPSG